MEATLAWRYYAILKEQQALISDPTSTRSGYNVPLMGSPHTTNPDKQPIDYCMYSIL